MPFNRNNPVLKQRRRELRKNQTEAEKAFWSHIRNEQLAGMKFFRQYSVGPYILDFYCPKLKLAVELDGGQHAQDENRHYDEERTTYLKAHQIDVMRFWNHDVLTRMEAILVVLLERILSSKQDINSPTATSD